MTKCPACSAEVADGEKFCAACGAAITVVDGVAEVQAPAPSPPVMDLPGGYERDARIGRARKWLMAISIITLVSGFAIYAIGRDEVETELSKAEAQLAHLDPETRDARLKSAIGMTWEEVQEHDRGLVRMLLFVNIGLSAAYLGMWFWAKKNPLAASVTALLLFITVIVVSGVLQPTSLAQGVLVKILFIGALAKAISAAQEERRLQAIIPRATVA